jgi:two-component system, LytTR family, response regulator LytT
MNILVIEDEGLAARRLIKMLDRILADLGPWGKVPSEVAWCGDADLALAEAAKGPDLILLDLNLGSFNSLEWIKARKLPADRLIIVSADTRYCDEAFALGVFAYVFKPVDEALLASHLERFIRARGLAA